MPTDEAVVEAAAEAAEAALLSAFDRSSISDLDVRIDFTDGELTVDVYIDTTAHESKAQDAVNRAVAAAEAAVDELFEAE